MTTLFLKKPTSDVQVFAWMKYTQSICKEGKVWIQQTIPWALPLYLHSHYSFKAFLLVHLINWAVSRVFICIVSWHFIKGDPCKHNIVRRKKPNIFLLVISFPYSRSTAPTIFLAKRPFENILRNCHVYTVFIPQISIIYYLFDIMVSTRRTIWKFIIKVTILFSQWILKRKEKLQFNTKVHVSSLFLPQAFQQSVAQSRMQTDIR